MKILRSPWVFVPIAMLGAIGGLVWWNFWGCTDSCPINSSWKISMLRGTLLAVAAGLIFLPLKTKNHPTVEE